MKKLMIIAMVAATFCGCKDQLLQAPDENVGAGGGAATDIVYTRVERIGTKKKYTVMLGAADGAGSTMIADGFQGGAAGPGRVAYTRGDSVIVATRSGGKWTERVVMAARRDSSQIIPGLPITLSPDGRLITYAVHERSKRADGFYDDLGTITYLTLADGSAGPGIPLPKVISGESTPVFSPDSKWLAFYARQGSSGQNNGEVWVMSTGASADVQRVANGINVEVDGGAWLDWSPNSDRIVYHADGTGLYPNDTLRSDMGAIHIVNRDGSGARKLVDGSYPVWSPDGKSIAYIGGPTLDIFMINADGSGVPRNISNSVGTAELYPQWSPDGKKILYTVYAGDNEKVPGTIKVSSVTDPSDVRTISPVGENALKGFWVR